MAVQPSILLPRVQAASAIFLKDHGTAWAGYIFGCVLVLMREKGLRGSGTSSGGSRLPGCRLLIESGVPEGKGVSSSAAVEVATMQVDVPCVRVRVCVFKREFCCPFVGCVRNRFFF